jgi:ribose 5-phosphate isomerase A
MSDSPIEKLQAARAAAELVESGMTVGLGTGSTASLVVQRLGERVAREGLRIQGVATSRATAELATCLGIPLIDLDCVAGLDIAIDGADEVDPRFRLIKGRGGALLREKIVAAASRRRVIVVTPEKLVERLGQSHEVPVEVSSFGLKHTENMLRNHGASTAVRRAANGSLVVTDEGHRIIDCRFLSIEDPEELNQRLNGIVGVFETGLFVGLCDQLVVGRADGAEIHDYPLA